MLAFRVCNRFLEVTPHYRLPTAAIFRGTAHSKRHPSTIVTDPPSRQISPGGISLVTDTKQSLIFLLNRLSQSTV